jgi:hypothetical protein
VKLPPTGRAGDDLKVAEPKTLRYRLWHTAGRIVHHARRVIVRIDRAWPWTADLITALAGYGPRRRPAKSSPPRQACCPTTRRIPGHAGMHDHR